jgi:succinoglycan biosynthesis protein ExoV
MKLFYYVDPHGNFGDDVNGWLWHRLIPEALEQDDDVNLSVIGTIIGPRMWEGGRWVVMGSGVGYGPPPRDFGGPNWTIECVRGPLTTRVLGLPSDKAVVDPAVLIATLPEYAPLPESEREGVVFMPHHEALQVGRWEEACALAGVTFLSPRMDSKYLVERIRRSKLMIADAMHGAIIADCLRTPWVAVSTSQETSTFKWLDWAASLGIKYEPIHLPSSSAAEALRSQTLHFYGQKYRTAPDVEVAVAHLQRDLATKRKPLSFRKRSFGHGVYKRFLLRALNSTPLRRWKTAWDDRCLHSAAGALKVASASEGRLSDAGILKAKTEQLQAVLARYAYSRAAE